MNNPSDRILESGDQQMKASKKGKKIQKVGSGSSKQTKNNKALSKQVIEQQDQQLKSSNREHIKTIVIQFDQFQQIYQQIDIQTCINTISRGLVIKRLMSLLQNQFNLFTKDKLIKFYLYQGGVYVTVPTNKKCLALFQIQHEDYFANQTLKLQLFKDKELIDVVMHDDSQQQSQQNQHNQNDQDAENQQQKNMEGNFYQYQGKCRRLKERKIKYVIEKVLKWRQLYAGVEDGQENPSKRVPLEQGAKIVKISKKTLDDYLSQLKKGKRYGFNFNDHKNQKVGVLREFIRKIQKKK